MTTINSAFSLKQGDTSPTYSTVITDNSGKVVNLTGASVTFYMASLTQGTVVSAAATVTNATAGAVSYSWQTNDTSIPDIYSASWLVTFAGGAKQSYPLNGYNTVHIYNDLAIGYPGLSGTLFNTIRSGSALPTAAIGNNGDYYYCTANTFFYGPKAAGAWPSGFPLEAAGGLPNPATFAGSASVVGTFAAEANSVFGGSSGSYGGGLGVISLLNAGTNPSSAPSGGAVVYSANGGLKWAGDDGLLYQGGSYISAATSTQTIASTSPTTITSLSAVVGSGSYYIDIYAPYLGGTSAGTAVFNFTSPSTSVFGGLGKLYTGVTLTLDTQVTSTATTFTSGTLSTATMGYIEIHLVATFTASGTFALQVKEGTSGDTVIVQVGANMKLTPIN